MKKQLFNQSDIDRYLQIFNVDGNSVNLLHFANWFAEGAATRLANWLLEQYDEHYYTLEYAYSPNGNSWQIIDPDTRQIMYSFDSIVDIVYLNEKP